MSRNTIYAYKICMLLSLLNLIIKTLAATNINKPAKMQFSRHVGNYVKIRTFIDVSVVRCKEECDRRARCQALVYNRRTTQCILASHLTPASHQPSDPATTEGERHVKTGFDNGWISQNDEGTVIVETGTTLDGRGTVVITVINSDGNVMCGDNKCDRHCIEEETGPDCKATECGEPPHRENAFTILQGNMYSVKNKLVLRDRWEGPFEKLITCGDGGDWEWDRQDTTRDYCQDFVETTTSTSGLYMLEPSIQVVNCDMDTDDGHWMVFQRRMDGSVDFYRDWKDYVMGFGILNGEFWFGLDGLFNILLSGEFELRVDLGDFSGQHKYAKYNTFKLEGPQDNYRLSVSGYTGDAGDSLLYHNGMQFTTRDADHDLWHANCAQYFKGAWWYIHCHESNLNGLYYHGGENTTTYANHVQWLRWLGQYHSLKTTEMKIRRKRN